MAFPYHEQETNYTCGAAAMRMALASAGIKRSEKQVVKLLKTNKVRGSWTKNFSKVAEKFKLKFIEKHNARLSDLKKYKTRYTVILCYLYPPEKVDHYSVLRKIDSKYIHFWDPFFGKDHKYKIAYFNKIWACDPRYEKIKKWFFAIKK